MAVRGRAGAADGLGRLRRRLGAPVGVAGDHLRPAVSPAAGARPGRVGGGGAGAPRRGHVDADADGATARRHLPVRHHHPLAAGVAAARPRAGAVVDAAAAGGLGERPRRLRDRPGDARPGAGRRGRERLARPPDAARRRPRRRHRRRVGRRLAQPAGAGNPSLRRRLPEPRERHAALHPGVGVARLPRFSRDGLRRRAGAAGAGRDADAGARLGGDADRAGLRLARPPERAPRAALRPGRAAGAGGRPGRLAAAGGAAPRPQSRPPSPSSTGWRSSRSRSGPGRCS